MSRVRHSWDNDASIHLPFAGPPMVSNSLVDRNTFEGLTAMRTEFWNAIA